MIQLSHEKNIKNCIEDIVLFNVMINGKINNDTVKNST